MDRLVAPLSPSPNGQVLGGAEPFIFHCNHYNYWLQRTVLLIPDIGMEDVCVDAAASVVHNVVSRAGAELGLSGPEAHLRLASGIFSQHGFGTIDFSGASADGGTVVTPTSHYGQLLGACAKIKIFKTPQNYFDRGFAAGALAAAHGLPAGAFGAAVVSCHSTGADQGVTKLSRRTAPDDFFVSPGAGMASGGIVPPPFSDTSVDEAGILEALSGLDFSGNEEGFTPRFGVLLTHHFANYYSRISFEFLRRMAHTGMSSLAEVALVDAAHHCAFNTFGGIMVSAEWDAVIKPQCKTDIDWVHGMVATVNALGWGVWRVHEVSPDRLVVRIYDDYESRGYVGMYGDARRPPCYLAQGGVAGIMNLLYEGDIRQKPTMNDEYYVKVFDSDKGFVARQTTSRAQGSEYTEIVAERR